MTIVDQQILTTLMLAALPVGLIVYARMAHHAWAKGGRVRTELIDIPDAMVATVLVGFLIHQVISRLGATVTPKITAEHVLPNVLVFLGLLALLIGFLRARRIDPRRFFGLYGLGTGRALLLALGFLLALLPLLMAIAAITAHSLGADAKEQDLVGIFRDSAGRGNLATVATIILAGGITQPLVEEVFFRGYFYVIGKRYCGALPSAVFTSALFAAIHFNLMALPALFVLALALTLAYEVTGSMIVPFGMHALFNSLQLGFLLWQAQSIPPA